MFFLALFFKSQNQLTITWSGFKIKKIHFNHITSKAIYSKLCEGHTISVWVKHLWFSFMPSSWSVLVWWLLYERLPTHDKLQQVSFIFKSRCTLNKRDVVTAPHLFLHCAYSYGIWLSLEWVSKNFGSFGFCYLVFFFFFFQPCFWD